MALILQLVLSLFLLSLSVGDEPLLLPLSLVAVVSCSFCLLRIRALRRARKGFPWTTVKWGFTVAVAVIFLGFAAMMAREGNFYAEVCLFFVLPGCLYAVSLWLLPKVKPEVGDETASRS